MMRSYTCPLFTVKDLSEIMAIRSTNPKEYGIIY